MNIRIENGDTFSKIQQDFSTLFPGLKLEFFLEPGAGYDGPFQYLKIGSKELVSAIIEDFKPINFDIEPNQSVASLEEDLSKILGLNVQVYRRSKDLWIQTTSTDNWELERQNTKGLHSMIDYKFSTEIQESENK